MRYRVFQRGWRGAGREMGVQPHVPHSTLLSSAHLWGHPYVQGPQDASRGGKSLNGEPWGTHQSLLEWLVPRDQESPPSPPPSICVSLAGGAAA